MGVNYVDFLAEANRVLVPNGSLLIAEVHSSKPFNIHANLYLQVISRIPVLGDFISLVEKLGFDLTDRDETSPMFVMLDFRKSKRHGAAISLDEASSALQPCIYKRR